MRNAVQVAGVGLIELAPGRHLGAEFDFQAVQIAAAQRQLVQRKFEPAGFGADRQEPARQRARVLDRLIDQPDDFIDRFAGLRAALLHPGPEAAQHQGHAGQFLSQAIVQVAADALPLAAGDIEDFLLQTTALGHITRGNRNAGADPGVAHQHGTILEVLQLIAGARFEFVRRGLTGLEQNFKLLHDPGAGGFRQQHADLAADDFIDGHAGKIFIDEAHAQGRVEQHQRVRGIRGGGAQQLLGAPQPPFRVAPFGDVLDDAHQAARQLLLVEQRTRNGLVPSVAFRAGFEAKFLLHFGAIAKCVVDAAAHRRPVRGMHPRQQFLHAGKHAGQVRFLAIDDGELEHVLCPVPAPGMHVRHVHRQLQPAGTVLQGDARQLLRLHVLQGAEGAKRAAVQHLHMADDAHPDALLFQGGDLELEIDRRTVDFGAFAGAVETLQRFGGALRLHRVPGHREFRRVRLVDAIHLLGPGELARHVAVFPAAHFGGALGFGQQVGDALDFRHIDAKADRAHRVAAGIALDEAALEDGSVASADIANAIGGGPAPAAQQPQAHGFLERLEIAGMDALAPGIDGGFKLFGFEAQHLEHASGAVHEGARNIPLVDDAVHGVRRQAKHFLALRKPALRQLLLRDIARVDHHARDQFERRGPIVDGHRPGVGCRRRETQHDEPLAGRRDQGFEIREYRDLAQGTTPVKDPDCG